MNAIEQLEQAARAAEATFARARASMALHKDYLPALMEANRASLALTVARIGQAQQAMAERRARAQAILDAALQGVSVEDRAVLQEYCLLRTGRAA